MRRRTRLLMLRSSCCPAATATPAAPALSAAALLLAPAVLLLGVDAAEKLLPLSCCCCCWCGVSRCCVDATSLWSEKTLAFEKRTLRNCGTGGPPAVAAAASRAVSCATPPLLLLCRSLLPRLRCRNSCCEWMPLPQDDTECSSCRVGDPGCCCCCWWCIEGGSSNDAAPAPWLLLPARPPSLLLTPVEEVLANLSLKFTVLCCCCTVKFAAGAAGGPPGISEFTPLASLASSVGPAPPPLLLPSLMLPAAPAADPADSCLERGLLLPCCCCCCGLRAAAAARACAAAAIAARRSTSSLMVTAASTSDCIACTERSTIGSSIQYGTARTASGSSTAQPCTNLLQSSTGCSISLSISCCSQPGVLCPAGSDSETFSSAYGMWYVSCLLLLLPAENMASHVS